MNEIVVTGIGVISPIGIGREAFRTNLANVKTGIKRITSFDTSSFHSDIGGCIEDFDPREFMSPGAYRRMGRVSRMAVAASIEALDDSGLVLDNMDRERVAVIVGTAYGSSSQVEDFYVSLLENGPRGAQPFFFPETVPNAPASHIGIFHKITGPNTTFCQNELSAEIAMCYARSILLLGLVDVALVGGVDELSPILFQCYDALGALNRTKAREGQVVDPKPGCGLVLGEGACVLVLERGDFAAGRGAETYGVVKSGVVTGGIACPGHYEPEGDQMGRAMTVAMEHAGVAPDAVDGIHVSANFSGELERMECLQLEKAFGKHLMDLRVTPLKYLTGDYGGAGTLRAAAILMGFRHQSPPPTVAVAMLEAPPERPLKWDCGTTGKSRCALITTSTFGGGSSSFVFINE
jgi:3-oxoacyl-[acyl-carrier-protein] synthase II